MEKYIRTSGEKQEVAVLISFMYGSGWSSCEPNPKIKYEMAMNKYLVEYIMQCKEKNINPSIKEVNKIWDTHISKYPKPKNMNGIKTLNIYWIEKKACFKIKNFKGAEYIFHPEDDLSWMQA